MNFLESCFKLKQNNTTVKTEIYAGLTTFMTMAYILIVNPSLLSASGMDSGAVLTATALGAAIGTFAMAALSNYPFALAPGMGLNAYFAYTVVMQMGYSWQMALAAVFVEGIIFIILSINISLLFLIFNLSFTSNYFLSFYHLLFLALVFTCLFILENDRPFFSIFYLLYSLPFLLFYLIYFLLHNKQNLFFYLIGKDLLIFFLLYRE